MSSLIKIMAGGSMFSGAGVEGGPGGKLFKLYFYIKFNNLKKIDRSNFLTFKYENLEFYLVLDL